MKFGLYLKEVFNKFSDNDPEQYESKVLDKFDTFVKKESGIK